MVPSGWEKHPVGKICSSIVPGRNKPKQFGGDIAWVTTPEITGKFIPSSVQENYISEETIKECGGKVVPKGAVVMAAVGDLGLIAITKEEVVLNQQLHAFVCSPKINNEFLAYWLATQTPYMESVASKTTILYLNKTNCESIPVLVPPILEQQKIANILSTWDKAISTTERLIENSTQQKKSLMQQLLTGKKRLLDDEGKRFEGEWEEVSVGSLGKIYSGGTPSTSNTEYWDGDINWITPTDITKQDSRYINSSLRKITLEGLENSSAKLVPAGSLLICTRATIGAMAITSHEMCTNQGFKNIVPNSKTNIEFVYYLLTYNKHRMINKASGSTFLELSKTSFESMKFKVPTLPEQQKIATVLTNADKEIELLDQQLADLQQEKKALMQVLLTGKRRVVVDGES